MTGKKIDVVMCMGSACFARGNNENLMLLEQLEEFEEVNTKIEIMGERCENKCEKGPHVKVNGKLYSEVTKEKLQEIIKNI